MPLNAPLNSRQIAVLRWIGEGCPDGRWTDSTYKTVAIALQSRRLVSVSKRGGRWTATIEQAGGDYLAHGDYPPGHWGANNRRASAGGTRAIGQASTRMPNRRNLPPVGPPTPRRPPMPNPPGGLTPTRKLLKDIIDAGGILERDTRDDDTRYGSLVGIINRRRMAPDGQEIIMLSGATYRHVIFRLSSVSDWKTEPPSKTVAAERIGRWHQVVSTMRAEKRLDLINKPLRDRAFRLLHAIAREGEARGHSVRSPKRSVRGYVEDPTRLVGVLILDVNGIHCSVNISQPKDRVPHAPTREEIEREKKYSWPPPKYDYVPADRLSVTIDTNSRWSSKVGWSDTKTLPLELRLPDVMTTFERWAVIDAERQNVERRAEAERQRTREKAERLAEIQHASNGTAVTRPADAQQRVTEPGSAAASGPSAVAQSAPLTVDPPGTLKRKRDNGLRKLPTVWRWRSWELQGAPRVKPSSSPPSRMPWIAPGSGRPRKLRSASTRRRGKSLWAMSCRSPAPNTWPSTTPTKPPRHPHCHPPTTAWTSWTPS